MCVCAPFSFYHFKHVHDPKKESDFLQFDLHFSSFFRRFYRLNICFSHFEINMFLNLEFSSGFLNIWERIFVCPQQLMHTCTWRYTMANTAETRLLDFIFSGIFFSLFSALECIFIVSNKFNVKLPTTIYLFAHEFAANQNML